MTRSLPRDAARAPVAPIVSGRGVARQTGTWSAGPRSTAASRARRRIVAVDELKILGTDRVGRDQFLDQVVLEDIPGAADLGLDDPGHPACREPQPQAPHAVLHPL